MSKAESEISSKLRSAYESDVQAMVVSCSTVIYVQISLHLELDFITCRQNIYFNG